MGAPSIERCIELVDASPLSAGNKALLRGFKDECLANGLGAYRVAKYLSLLRSSLSWLGKEARDAQVEDLKRVAAHIEASEYAAWTKSDHKLALRMFFTWLAGGVRPPTVSWMRIRPPKGRKMMPTDLLTPDDIKALIAAADHPRDRAFVALLFESGARIGEMLALHIRDVVLDDHGAQLFLDGKTGQRRVRLVASVPLLTMWLNVHPKGRDSRAPLWTGRDHRCQALDYGRVSDILRELGAKAALSKPVNPHHFRHSRATILAKHLTDAQMKEYLGWTQGSAMSAVYVHLSGRDVDDAILAMHGLKTQEDRTETAIRVCLRCQHENSYTNLYCGVCGLVLDPDDPSRSLEAERRTRLAEELVAALAEPATRADTAARLAEILTQAAKTGPAKARDTSQVQAAPRRRLHH